MCPERGRIGAKFDDTSFIPLPSQSMKTTRSLSLQSGFSLIELMIVVVVIAVLASIALPSYNEYVQRSHRANARAALLQASQWMERAATAQGRYPLNAAIPAGILTVEGGRYTIATDSTTGATFTFTATPTAVQENDRCGGFNINQSGTRQQSTTTTVITPLSAAECWNR